MKKSVLLCLFFLITSYLINQPQIFASDELSKIQEAIALKGAKWQAGESWVTKLSKEERKQLCGTILTKPDAAEIAEKFISLPTVENLPSKFDWRDNSGNWVTPVTNQGNCGSCWDFSAVAQVEAWWKITNSNLDSMPDLSEQYVLSCSPGTCSGWSVSGALSFIQTEGIPFESCFPYEQSDTVPCDDVCDNWQENMITIPSWGYITLDEAIVENIKNAIMHHPVSASYTVYEDFMSYNRGVYEHVWGEVEAGHAILIVGWDDAYECWICKNSWGPSWGENGYFRIKWGDSGMGEYLPFIWDGKTGGNALIAQENSFDFSLTIGDSFSFTLTLNNVGPDLLQYAAMDYECPTIFHIDSYNSYDGSSWWCGDPEIGGYSEHWLQYLDTPPINLSGTSSPKLDFMGFWAVEDPAGADAPWDGWDGCNVWISTDGGETYKVINPVSPAYNAHYLWSFGHPEQGWDLGPNIEGWGGKSNGWVPVSFDLNNYKSEQVIIRFALASDQGYSTVDDATLLGFFVDEIKVTDGTTTIFEDHGDDESNMNRIGNGLREADWLTLQNGVGVIDAHGSTDLVMTLNTRALTPGNYSGLINLLSNDTMAVPIEIPLTFDLKQADYDVSLEKVVLPSGNLPLLFPVEPGTIIKNKGLKTVTNFDVNCKILNGETVIFSDSSHVESLLPNTSQTINFDPFKIMENGDYRFIIEFMNLSNDYNSYNNQLISKAEITNLVDGFEEGADLWTFQDGWGVTEKLAGLDSRFSTHINGGTFPYPGNMDTYMTFKPGFDITDLTSLKLKFWTKYVTELDKDICSVEASNDQINWTVLDSFSGSNFVWNEREIDLNNFIQNGFDKLWIRFHFVSDDVNSFVGVVIDNVEIYPEINTDVAQNHENVSIPSDWKLTQNFPNPFNMNTQFEISVPEPSNIKVTIFNIRGEVVRNVFNSNVSAGHQVIEWDGRDNFNNVVGTGVYFYKVEAPGKFTSTQKMILMK